MTNSADPDQPVSDLGSTLFAKTGHIMFSKKRIKQSTVLEQNYNTKSTSLLLHENHSFPFFLFFYSTYIFDITY